jgi:hypothetical protein
MIKFGINYCDASGMMAKCVACNAEEQSTCDGFCKHTLYSRCVHLAPGLNNHCDSWKQYQAFREIGVVTAADFEKRLSHGVGDEETILNIEDLIECEEESQQTPTCMICDNRGICPALSSIGLTYPPAVYESEALNCPDYLEEALF